MEIVIENPSSDVSASLTSPINPNFPSHPGHLRPYRPVYGPNVDPASPTVEYYTALQHPRPRSRLISPEPDFEAATSQIPTSVRRVDRSGLLEIAELEPPRNSGRTRSSNGSENGGHSGTLTRRIDRSGLLEAVPEVPDQCQGWRSPEKTSATSCEDSRTRVVVDRQLTGAEIDDDANRQKNSSHRQQSASPRSSRSPIDTASQSLLRRSSETPSTTEDCRSVVENRTIVPSPTKVHGSTVNPLSSSVSSPYLRRYPTGGGGTSPTSSLERPTPIIVTATGSTEEIRNRNRNSFGRVTSPGTTKFLPIDGIASRNRQSYVDLTGASYTRSTSTSPIAVSRTVVDANATNIADNDDSKDKRQQPDCLGRLSPRSRNDGNSSNLLTMSAIPDVIEAHGSRNHSRDRDPDGKDVPEGQRAEAEGCEHSAGSSLEENRVSFKTTNKIIHNDNIQTLRVIILSEQL